ncbi:hypothetical protein [Escherichia phage phiWec179]|nr:hypothetical protein [Escherichia phage phiWec179]BDU12360.1 hypothetical protein [Escherichia phage phiWec181]BDU12800.1 hypothetical protein [Escherichia phage phiWec186]
MNKDRFLSLVAEAPFDVLGVRLWKDRNYGLDVQTYSLWLVGEHSLDKSLCMGVDTLPLCLKFRSLERANKEQEKLTRWLNENK